MTGKPDTIIALASGAGRAGVAVIRISGRDALGVLSHLGVSPPPPREARVRVLRQGDDQRLDEAVVLYFAGPASFTGEDVVELHVHGGTAVIAAVIDAALASRKCRLAEPGEFTRRAFESGRIDLTQAEGIADLVDAETEAQRRQAARIYAGDNARIFDSWRERLIAAMAALEASVDFPDESDVGAGVDRAALAPMRSLGDDLKAALSEAGRGEAIREGFRIAILGAPNAGKSSLLNRFARREAAIVSPLPGTTRDVVEVRVVLAGFPVWLADTAGLRTTADLIEAEGVRRALERAEHADLRVWVVDAADPAGVSRETLATSGARPGDLVLLNKTDLTADLPALAGPDVFPVSAATGEGLEAVEQALARIVVSRLGGDEAPVITRARHRMLVEEALDHVRRAIAAAEAGLGAELVSEDLRLAARALGRITGAVDVEDLLDRIFGDFCIGK